MKTIVGAVIVGFCFATGFWIHRKLVQEPVDNLLAKREVRKFIEQQAAGACHVAPAVERMS